jgi:hypothetical protein
MAIDPVGPAPGTSRPHHTFSDVSASAPTAPLATAAAHAATADAVPTDGTRTSRVVRALPLLLAALLAVAAFGTVGNAGCDDPGTYVSTPDGIALVGGCVTSGDIVPMTDPSMHDPASRRG